MSLGSEIHEYSQLKKQSEYNLLYTSSEIIFNQTKILIKHVLVLHWYYSISHPIEMF
jgi:hypothetical protein